MCIYSPMPHTLSYCALIGKCALIRSNTVLSGTLFSICLPIYLNFSALALAQIKETHILIQMTCGINSKTDNLLATDKFQS